MTQLYTVSLGSPLGTLALYASDHGLTHVWLKGDPRLPAIARSNDILERTRAQLVEYFAGTRTAFDVPLAGAGTPFQQQVWKTLVTIPFGATWSYGELAQAIGKPSASRAVGAANGKNPIAIIVPCHRVIGANGTLTGYAGGLANKQGLLAHERRVAGSGATLFDGRAAERS